MSVSFASCSFSYTHRRRMIFEELCLSFPRGSTVLLGPNGAGKSTLLGLAAAVLRPSSGSVRLGDLTTLQRRQRMRYQRRVGWLPQTVTPTPGLRLREQVAYAGWLKGMSRRDAWDAAALALRRVELHSKEDVSARTLSGGQLRRAGIAQVLVHGAEVMLLDEPTAGLDPAQRANFADLVQDLSNEVDIIVSTHQTEDLTTTYGHVVLLDEGSVRFEGTTDQFLSRSSPRSAPGRQAESAYTELMRTREN
jgi:ABC-2 type transport system ATP-binding protein